MSPQKVRLVVDLIRGQRAEEALQILRFTKKRAARDVEKVLRSAIANAERKAEDAGASLDVDELFVSRLFRERRFALEAAASRADGPRVPLPEAHRAHRRGRRRAPWRRASSAPRLRQPKPNREGRARRGKEGAASAGGNAPPGRSARPSRNRRRVSREELWDRRHIHTDFALGYNKPWRSRWYAGKDYADLLHEDVKLREQLKERLRPRASARSTSSAPPTSW